MQPPPEKRRHWRHTNFVGDIGGAQADTVQHTIPTKRRTNPLNPAYRSLDGDILPDPTAALAASTTTGPAQRFGAAVARRRAPRQAPAPAVSRLVLKSSDGRPRARRGRAAGRARRGPREEVWPARPARGATGRRGPGGGGGADWRSRSHRVGNLGRRRLFSPMPVSATVKLEDRCRPAMQPGATASPSFVEVDGARADVTPSTRAGPCGCACGAPARDLAGWSSRASGNPSTSSRPPRRGASPSCARSCSGRFSAFTVLVPLDDGHRARGVVDQADGLLLSSVSQSATSRPPSASTWHDSSPSARRRCAAPPARPGRRPGPAARASTGRTRSGARRRRRARGRS